MLNAIGYYPSDENAAINFSLVSCSNPPDLMTNVCDTVSSAATSFDSSISIRASLNAWIALDARCESKAQFTFSRRLVL